MKFKNLKELTFYIQMTGNKPGLYFFYGGYLSQWYMAKFQVDGVVYNCAEQYMMAQKALLFNDMEAHERIMESGNASEQKFIGRCVNGFDKDIWMVNDFAFNVVVKASIHKFSIPFLKKYLLETKDKVLVEASKYDTIWGIGIGSTDERSKDPSQWLGTNLLGFALMEAREILRNDNNCQ